MEFNPYSFDVLVLTDQCCLTSALSHFRRVELERKLQADVLMSEERKNRQRAQHGKRESQYLRLRRTKIGLDDFRTVKVIGKGAFGEVSLLYWDLIISGAWCDVG